MKKVVLGLLFITSQSWAAKYDIDASHTQVGFEVSHMMVSTVPGRFDKFEGSFELDEKSGKVTALSAKIDASSINTNSKDRDDHLRNADFFDVAKYPHIEFVGSDTTVGKGKGGKLKGKLTMHGKTEEVILDIKQKGPVVDPWGKNRIGFEAKTTIDRKKFGLTWNKVMEAGGVAVGNEVEIIIKGEAVNVPAAGAAKSAAK